jgi:hypothetical protein
MVHARKGLALRFEAFQQDVVSDACANEFDGDEALKGSGLFGKPHLAHPAFTKFAHQAIRPDGLR